MAENKASMSDVFNYLSDNKSNGYTMSEFRKDWSNLTDKDKDDLRNGIGNGSLTY